MNKISYIKDLGKYELCMVYGYVAENHWNVFMRDRKSNYVVKDFGVLTNDDAFSIFNSIEKGGR